MDAFCIYTLGGRALIEQIYIKDEQNKIKNDLKDLANGKKVSEYWFVVNSNNSAHVESESKEENQILQKTEGSNFVYLVKKSELQYISFKKNESNPMLILEIINEIINILKSYFNVNKLNENIIINNYSTVNFLIDEILTQGKPSLFIDDILKKMIKNESSFLNETLKITPLPNSIYNMISQKNKNPINANLLIEENNINFSFSNGSCINSKESMCNYWRVSNNSVSTNEIYIDIIENVNCVVNEQNKVLHYGVVGNIVVNTNINGCPVIKMYVQNLNLNECTFHFTVNYSKIIKKKKLNKKENVIYFTPLNREYTVLKYFFLHSSFSSMRGVREKITENSSSHLYEQMTDVLNIPKKRTKTSIDIDEDDENKEGTHEQKKEMPLLESINFYNQSTENEPEIISRIENASEFLNENLNRNIVNRECFGLNMPSEMSFLFNEENENICLPIKLDSDIIFLETENMYKIKIFVKYNNICKEKDSNFLLSNYENIVLKMPIHNFINSVNLHCSIGSIGYIEKSNCIYWQIKNVTDKNISTYANISLYVKPEVGNTYGKDYMPFHENNLGVLIYPFFKLVVYASLKVNGISVTGKKIEKVEITEAKNIDMYKGCRYTTFFKNIEFRL